MKVQSVERLTPELGPETWAFVNLDGHYHNADTPLFSGVVGGESVEIILDRFGFTNRSRRRVAGGPIVHVLFGVPEPSTWPLLIAGLAALPILTRRRF